MADKEDALAISEESKAMLEDHVKKGKARKFIPDYQGCQYQDAYCLQERTLWPKNYGSQKGRLQGRSHLRRCHGQGGQRRVSIAREQRCCQFHEDRRRARCRTLQDCQTP